MMVCCTTGSPSTCADKIVLIAPVASADSAGICIIFPKISTSWKKIAQIYLPDLPLFTSLHVLNFLKIVMFNVFKNEIPMCQMFKYTNAKMYMHS